MIHSKERVKFDVDNKEHVEIYRKFLETQSWRHSRGCVFELEFPYTTVPDMIKDKLIHKFMKVERYAR